MSKILLLILILFTVTNCNIKKVVDHHGVPFLEKKQNSLIVNKTNKNDINKLLGNPSTISSFDENTWIFIERKQTQSELKNLGKKIIYQNNLLVLKLDNKGILIDKNLYTLNDMNDLKTVETITGSNIQGNSFMYDFLSSLRQKMNDPLGVRAKKRKEINQR